MELQPCSDLFFLLGYFKRVGDKIEIILGAGLIDDNAIVVQVKDNREI